MEIEPQKMTLKQLQRAENGQLVDIDDDVNNVVRDLKAIDPHIRMRFSERTNSFIIYYRKDGKDKLITTAKELDQRVVRLIRKIGSNKYNYANELDKVDLEAKKAAQELHDEILSEKAQELAFALRQDRGMNNSSIFVPKNIGTRCSFNENGILPKPGK